MVTSQAGRTDRVPQAFVQAHHGAVSELPEAASAGALDRLLRWEQFGGSWRVLGRDAAGMTLSLRRCDGGEEVERLVSAEPALLAYVADRVSSDGVPAC